MIFIWNDGYKEANAVSRKWPITNQRELPYTSVVYDSYKLKLTVALCFVTCGHLKSLSFTVAITNTRTNTISHSSWSTELTARWPPRPRAEVSFVTHFAKRKRNKKDRYKNDNFTLISSLNPWASCFSFRKSFYSHAHYHTNPPYPLLHNILKVEAQVCSMWPVQFIYFAEKKENMRPIHILFDILRKNSHFDEHKC